MLKRLKYVLLAIFIIILLALSNNSNNYIKKLKTLTQVIRLINENYVEQLKDIEIIMKKFGFKLVKKEQSKYIKPSEPFKNLFNYIFSR